MGTVPPLPPEDLHHGCDPAGLPFESTAELEELGEMLGQDRAVEAIELGTGLGLEGYNLFVLGPPGTGRHSFIRQFLDEVARGRPRPSDWCYVNNFSDARRPTALEFPAGGGVQFRERMSELVEEARVAIPAAFESEDYASRRQAIEKEAEEEQEKAFEEVRKNAYELGLGIMHTDTGFNFVPLRDGEVIPPEEFEKLPEEEQKRIAGHTETVSEDLRKMLRAIPPRVRSVRSKISELNREVALFAVGGLMDELKELYEDNPPVRDYLASVQHDIADNVELFTRPEGLPSPVLRELLVDTDAGDSLKESRASRRYGVNLLVDQGEEEGAPVVFEDYPNYSYLVGQIEHISRLGVLITDFNLIRAGALHRANGGYLVVDAQKILSEPFAWIALKRALKARSIDIRSPAQAYSLVSTVTLEPEPIPLDVKVILIGDRLLYYLLEALDPEFLELFRVAADFEDEMERTSDNELKLVRLVGAVGRREGLLPLDRTAAARIVDESARHAGDAEMLSTQFRQALDIMREAHYWASRDGRDLIDGDHVQRAVDGQVRRMARIQDRVQREIQRGVIRVDTDGEHVGQVNGLSVIQLSGHLFGRPTRITARLSVGSGQVVDIEREVELGGPIHSKGVLILSSFLASHYVADRPLSLSASLVFEQSYQPVEGDSASAAELAALLSAVADTPICQSLSVTGSVDQHGRIQAIGGVNQKIEGFFDVCSARGLTGDQGVVIPSTNVSHLMLRKEVVDAVGEGRFQVYAVSTVDECMEVLTGLEAGERDDRGEFPEGTLNHRIRTRLIELAEVRKSFASEREPLGKPEP